MMDGRLIRYAFPRFSGADGYIQTRYSVPRFMINFLQRFRITDFLPDFFELCQYPRLIENDNLNVQDSPYTAPSQRL